MRVETAQAKKSPFVTLINTVTHSEQETFNLGKEFSNSICPNNVIALSGELGSGKTRFIQGICAGLHVTQDVTSPTFTLINEYIGRLPVYHFDFYRISSTEEVLMLGDEEYFYSNGVCLIEWADRITGILPSERIDICLKHLYETGKENKRHIHIRRISDLTR